MKKAQRRQAVFVLGLILFGVFLAVLRNLPHPKGNMASAGEADLAQQFLARKERWGAKTGVDDDAAKIDVANPKQTTVAELTAIDRPSDLPTRGGPGGDRYGPVEHTAYIIDADILRFKREESDDDDFHVVIADHDHPGQTMIVEIPDPRAVDPSSPWRADIVKARDTFDSEFHPTNRFTRHTAHVRITGIGFFDFLHGQSGVAPNGIELHPVLKVEILN
jgi:hypothetical protein